jgi:hypothetical protein
MVNRPRRAATVTAPVKLTDTQAATLMFFAGRRDDPYGQAPTVVALISRGLLAHDGESNRYQITELGRQVIGQLDRESADRYARL